MAQCLADPKIKPLLQQLQAIDNIVKAQKLIEATL